MSDFPLFKQFDLFKRPPTITDAKVVYDINAIPATFYQTVPTSPERRKRVASQNDRILGMFLNHPRTDFTPFAVHYHFGQQWPITSVRRALTQLTEAGYLVKTDTLRPGIYGEMNHTWKLRI
jgi:hypothetical protein